VGERTEPTPYCDACAHEVVEKLFAEREKLIDNHKAFAGCIRMWVGKPKKGETLCGLVGKLTRRVATLEDFATDCAKNFDCDSDAHKYNTTCRACAAKEALL
jgi:hypothetical protein